MTNRLLISPQAFRPPEIHQKVILIYSLSHFFQFRELVAGSKIKSFGPSKRFNFDCHDEPITVLGGLIGAPLAALAIEQACAYGKKSFFALGTAGWIGEREVAPGSCFLPQFGVDHTGIAADYGAQKTTFEFEPYRPIPLCRGIISTNSFFALSIQQVKQYRKQQIDLVDMESAAVLFLTYLKNCRFQPVVVVSDRVSKDFVWTNDNGGERFKEGLQVGMELLKQILPETKKID